MESKVLLVVAGVVLFAGAAFSATCRTGETCDLPDCQCPGFVAPNGMPVASVPQLVFLTFDDAITVSNYPIYEEHLFPLLNHNGANITMTFFITHEYNNYQLTHDLYRRGHGVALHSITHRTDTQYWATANASVWTAEVCDQKKQLSYFAKIPADYIKGFRVPFLQLGGDTQFQVLSSPECDLDYDCSRATRQYAGQTPYKMWPYTMDYDTEFHDCQSNPCPVRPYPGFWTVPMVSMFGDNGFPCAMVDTCIPTPTTQAETFALLKRNFDNHYTTQNIANRAPFGLFTHAAWIQGEENAGKLAGYVQFVKYLESLEDVYMVSIEKGLEYLRTPVHLDDILDFEPFKNKPMPPDECSFAFPCAFTNDQTPFPGERYMQSCQPCPRNYPWIYNWNGMN